MRPIDPENKKIHRISITVTERQYWRLMEIADKEGTSQAKIVRDLLDKEFGDDSN